MQCEIVLGLVILDKELKVLCCYVNFQVGRLPMEWAKTAFHLCNLEGLGFEGAALLHQIICK